MLEAETRKSEVERVIEKYGQGFDSIYFDGKYDGKIKSALNFLANGVDEELISECTGFSMDVLEKLKREL